MTDVNTQAIEYGRGWVYVTHNHNVNVYSLDEERRVREYMIRDQGYVHLHTVQLPPEPGKPEGWCLFFSRGELRLPAR